MVAATRIAGRSCRSHARSALARIPQPKRRFDHQRGDHQAVSAVLPCRTNAYVVGERIRWNRVPDDLLYQRTFPQPGMLEHRDPRRMRELVRSDAPRTEVGRWCERGDTPR